MRGILYNMSYRSFFGLKQKKKEELVLVLDVGNASVGGALVLLTPQDVPQIVFSTRSAITVSRTIHSSRLIQSLGNALERTLKDLNKNGMPHLVFTRRGKMIPRFVFCVFAAPWHVSHLRATAVSQPTSFEVTHDALSSILQKELETSKNPQTKEYLRSGVEGDRMIFLEKEVVRITLNGYETPKPFHRKTKKLESLFFVSMAPQDIIDLVKKKIERVFHIDDVRFHSFTLAFWNVVRGIWGVEKDYLLIDISGELSEISLVRDGALVETGTFPRGRNFFLRKIMSSFHVSIHEASSLLDLYFSGNLSNEVADRFETILNETKKEWLQNLKEALSRFSDGLFLPSHIFLAADEPLAKLLMRVIQDGKWGVATFTGEPFVVTLIGNEALANFSKTTSTRQDNFLIIDSLFAQKLHFLE